MAAAALAGLVLGILLGTAALLFAVLACAKRSESESDSLPLHTLTNTPPAKKDNQPAQADNKATQQNKDAKPAAAANNNNNKKGEQAGTEWSGAKLWQEYVAKAGTDTSGPQYVVFDAKTGKIELKPAPKNDAPFLKVHADGKVELVDAGGGGAAQQKGGGGNGGKQQQQQGEQKGKDEGKKDEKKSEGKKDEKKDEKKSEGKKDEKKDEKKEDAPKQAGNDGQGKGKEKAETKPADAKDNKADDKKADAKKDAPAANTVAAAQTACCAANTLSLHGPAELVQGLKALGVLSKEIGKGGNCAGCHVKHETTAHDAGCNYRSSCHHTTRHYKCDHHRHHPAHHHRHRHAPHADLHRSYRDDWETTSASTTMTTDHGKLRPSPPLFSPIGIRC